MQQEILEIVLTQVMEGQKEINQSNQEIVGKVDDTTAKVLGFNKKLEQMKVQVPPVDTKPVEQIISSGLKQIAAVVEAQPKTVIHKKEYHLFPQANKDYYNWIFFRRVVPWAFVFTIGFWGYLLLKAYLHDQAIANEKQAEFEPYMKAWQIMYAAENETGKKIMDNVWVNMSHGQ
jgi:hypothetical protein